MTGQNYSFEVKTNIFVGFIPNDQSKLQFSFLNDRLHFKTMMFISKRSFSFQDNRFLEQFVSKMIVS